MLLNTHRFCDALNFATRLHETQVRKGNKSPYIGHLLTVCGTVLDYGADEDTAIAALFHDAVEDRNYGGNTEVCIKSWFGEKVLNLVLECSDTTNSDAKEDWRERKERYIAKIKDKSDEALLILAADKLHNLSCTVRDLDVRGTRAFGCFNGKAEGTFWYYESIIKELEGRVNYFLLNALKDQFYTAKVLYQNALTDEKGGIV